MVEIESKRKNYQLVQDCLEAHGWRPGIPPNVPNGIIAVETGLMIQQVGTSIGHMEKSKLFGERTKDEKLRRVKEGANLALEFGYPDYREYAEWRMVGEEIAVALAEKDIQVELVHINNGLVKARKRGDLMPETSEERSHVHSTVVHAKQGEIEQRVPLWIQTASLIQWQNLDITPLRRADWFLLIRFKTAVEGNALEELNPVEAMGQLRPFAEAIRTGLPQQEEIVSERRGRIIKELAEKANFRARMEEIKRRNEQERQSLIRKLEIKNKKKETVRRKQRTFVEPIRAILVPLGLDDAPQNFYQYTIVDQFRQAHAAATEGRTEAIGEFDREMSTLPEDIVRRLQPCFGAIINPRLVAILIQSNVVGVPKTGSDWETLDEFFQAKKEQFQRKPEKFTKLVERIADLPERLTPAFKVITEYLAHQPLSRR